MDAYNIEILESTENSYDCSSYQDLQTRMNKVLLSRAKDGWHFTGFCAVPDAERKLFCLTFKRPLIEITNAAENFADPQRNVGISADDIPDMYPEE